MKSADPENDHSGQINLDSAGVSSDAIEGPEDGKPVLRQVIAHRGRHSDRRRTREPNQTAQRAAARRDDRHSVGGHVERLPRAKPMQYEFIRGPPSRRTANHK